MQQKPIEQVFTEYQDSLLSLPNVQGFYQGADEDGSAIIVLMLDTLKESNRNFYPRIIEGYPVKLEETGVIKPLDNSSPEE